VTAVRGRDGFAGDITPRRKIGKNITDVERGENPKR